MAIVTTSFPAHEGDPSGHFVRAHARQLERAGHDVQVLAPPPGGAFGWPGVAARVRARPWRAVGAAHWVTHVRARLEKMAPERVIAHWAIPSAWPIGTAAGAPIEVVSHGGDVRLLLRMPRRGRTWIVQAIAERAAQWCFVSAPLRDALLCALDGPVRARLLDISRVQPAALEMPDVRKAVIRKRQDLRGLRFAVSVGRLVAAKRVDRAIEHVARASDLDALVVVGDGPERRRLERLARTRGVDARFIGRTPREEALAWIGAADALIQASKSEGLSTVVREAEALGTRVIAL